MKKLVQSFREVAFLFQYFWRYGKLLFLLSFLGLFYGPIQSYISIKSIQYVVDSIAGGRLFKDIVVMLIIFFSSLLLLNIYTAFIDSFFWEKLMLKVNAGIKEEIFRHIIETDYKYFDNPQFYDNYSWTAANLSQLSIQSMHLIRAFLARLFNVVTLIILTTSMDHFLILFAVISLLIGLLIDDRINKITYKKNETLIPINRKQEYIDRLFYLKDYAEEIRTTKIGDLFFKIYKGNVKASCLVIDESRTKLTALNIASNIQEVLFTASCMIYLTFQIVVMKHLSIGEFTALVTASAQLKSSLMLFFGIINEIKNIALQSGKIRSFFDEKSYIEKNKAKGLVIDCKPYSIEIDNLHFRYAKDQCEILKGINLKIKAGTKVAIVGENGAGKTTLIKLLLRLYDVENGSICINGKNIKDICLEKFRENVAVVFQQSKVYAASLRDNMKIYDLDLKDEALYDALKLFGLDTIFSKSGVDLEAQMTKEFESDGIILSGGQAQLLAIARLFIKDFGLLILDEPSSALDPLREYELNKVMMHEIKGSTVIIISHRLSTVKDADCIYVMHNGVVAEQGTHNELLEQGGLYCEMFNRQAESYKN